MKRMKIILILILSLIFASCLYEGKSTGATIKLYSYRIEKPITFILEKDFPIISYSLEQKYTYKKNEFTHRITPVNYGFKLYVKNTAPTKIVVDYSLIIKMDGIIYLDYSGGRTMKAEETFISGYIIVGKENFNINDLEMDFNVNNIELIY